MKINSEQISEAPRDSATVIMLRDGLVGLEVFLVKRHAASAVLGGAYVFPGGKLDDTDSGLDDQAHMDTTAHAMHTALHEPETPVNIA